MEKAIQGDFKQRLAALRADAGWSQSELARQIWGTTTDGRGYEVAKNRDRISAYEAGRSKPNRENLEAIAAVFNIDVEELAPDLLRDAALSEPKPAVELRLEGSTAYLRINTGVPTDTALQIVKLLSDAGVK